MQSLLESAAPASSRSAASRRPSASGSRGGSGGRQPQDRRAVDGGGDPAQVDLADAVTARRIVVIGIGLDGIGKRRRPGRCSRLRARRAARARRRRPSGSADRPAPLRSRGAARRRLSRHSIGERPLARRRQHLQRVEHLGDLRPAGRAGRGRPGRARRRRPRPRSALRMRVSTLPRIGTMSKPSPSACSWAVRRGEPVPIRAPGGSSPRREAGRADQRVARVLAQRHGGERDPGRRRGRQVLQRVHGEVDPALRAAPRAARSRRRRCRRAG